MGYPPDIGVGPQDSDSPETLDSDRSSLPVKLIRGLVSVDVAITALNWQSKQNIKIN